MRAVKIVFQHPLHPQQNMTLKYPTEQGQCASGLDTPVSSRSAGGGGAFSVPQPAQASGGWSYGDQRDGLRGGSGFDEEEETL